jgi:hypothetical protein
MERCPPLKRLSRALRVIGLSACLLTMAEPGHASCGSAFCVLNTSWDMQTASMEPGVARLDLRYEFIDQKQLRSGSSSISAADVTEDVLEQRTINRNLLATIDYTISPAWGVSLALPAVSRSHSHIVDPTGAAVPESWNFSRAGDARVLGRYQFAAAQDAAGSYGLQFGLKLPTGDYRVVNAEGTLAERSLQPGTGSTDLILGGYYSSSPRFLGMSWFAQGFYQRAFETKDGFRPGDQISLTGGLRYQLSDDLTAQFQANALFRDRDAGINAEPTLSGGKFLFASPGLSYAVTHDTQVYGFLQLPLYRYVNGVQLSADWSAIAGLSTRF